ncbi:MAG TPA: type II toxin-antitoxin system RelE/ParE family toxin [Pyrinomonadaceae bacterium]|jgi:toxin ParE1/3/4
MANVKLSDFAAADLKEIWEYVAENNPSAAETLVREILQKIRLLPENPQMGKSRDEIFVGLQSFPVKNYVVFYAPIEDGVENYRVLHGRRDIEGMFEDYFEGLPE